MRFERIIDSFSALTFMALVSIPLGIYHAYIIGVLILLLWIVLDGIKERRNMKGEGTK